MLKNSFFPTFSEELFLIDPSLSLFFLRGEKLEKGNSTKEIKNWRTTFQNYVGTYIWLM